MAEKAYNQFPLDEDGTEQEISFDGNEDDRPNGQLRIKATLEKQRNRAKRRRTTRPTRNNTSSRPPGQLAKEAAQLTDAELAEAIDGAPQAPANDDPRDEQKTPYNPNKYFADNPLVPRDEDGFPVEVAANDEPALPSQGQPREQSEQPRTREDRKQNADAPSPEQQRTALQKKRQQAARAERPTRLGILQARKLQKEAETVRKKINAVRKLRRKDSIGRSSVGARMVLSIVQDVLIALINLIPGVQIVTLPISYGIAATIAFLLAYERVKHSTLILTTAKVLIEYRRTLQSALINASAKIFFSLIISVIIETIPIVSSLVPSAMLQTWRSVRIVKEIDKTLAKIEKNLTKRLKQIEKALQSRRSYKRRPARAKTAQ